MMAISMNQKTANCDCGTIQSLARHHESPIEYDENLDEYNLRSDQKVYYRLYFCFFCGGKLPESKRASLLYTESSPEPIQQKKLANADEESFGLLAIGQMNEWEVVLDETVSSKRFFAQIEGPSLYLHFEILSPDVVDKAIDFLGNQHPPSSTLLIGTQKNPVCLIRDDESRYFLVIGKQASPLIRVTITGTDLKQILECLRQVKEDLHEEKLPKGA